MTQGFPNRPMGSSVTPAPRAPPVNSSPDPLHSGLARSKVGQNPKLNAPAKVSFGAWASTP